MGTLYVVATPIGNMDDLSPRAVHVLREVSLIAAEDTRHTGRLLARCGIETPMVSYHAFNERAQRERLLAKLSVGDIALVSDAGTPAIADPGRDIVEAAFAAGHTVSPIPGPSAVTAAAAASGLIDGPFLVVGFLPRKGHDRAKALALCAAAAAPVILFEAPSRVAATLRDLASALGDRVAVVARELTKVHEEVRRDELSRLAAELDQTRVRGEVVIVVGPPLAAGSAAASRDDAADVLSALLRAGMKPSAAAGEAARVTGRPRAELYSLAVRLGRKEPAQSG